MFKSEKQFIFFQTPEMGGEKVVQNESVEVAQELPSGAELVDSLSNLDSFPLNEMKDALGITEQDTAEVDNIWLLLGAVA